MDLNKGKCWGGKALKWGARLLLMLLLVELYMAVRGFPAALDTYRDRLCIHRNPAPGMSDSVELEGISEYYWLNRWRSSRPLCLAPRPYRVLVVGCSFTKGEAVVDEDTYVWKLHNLCPKASFDNIAVGGFGPCQCLLQAERWIDKQRYDLLIYSSIWDHYRRNSTLVFDYRDGMMAIVPYISKDNGEWVIHKAQFPHWWGDSCLRFVNMVKNYWYMRKRFRERLNPEEDLEAKCYAITKMRELARERNMEFLHITLDYHATERELELPVDTLDACFLPYDKMVGNLRYMVSDKLGAHPNAYSHTLWAKKISAHLNERYFTADRKK